MGNVWTLLGVLIVIVGFVLKFDTLATVVVAGVVTGLIGGLSPMEILNMNIRAREKHLYCFGSHQSLLWQHMSIHS